MSTLRVNLLANSAGTSFPAFTNGLVDSTARSYHQAATPVVHYSFNVTSVSDDGAGANTTNFTNSYAVKNDMTAKVSVSEIGGNDYNGRTDQATGLTTSAQGVYTSNGGTGTDMLSFATVTGDLA